MYVVYEEHKCTQGSYGQYTEDDGLICDSLIVWPYNQGCPYPQCTTYYNVGVYFNDCQPTDIATGGCLSWVAVFDPPATYEVTGYWDC